MDRLRAKARLVATAAFLLALTAATSAQTPPPSDRMRGDIAILFEGNESFADAVLAGVAEQEIRSIRRGSGRVADLVDAAATLQSWYAEQGFPDARVRLRMIADPREDQRRTITSPEEFNTVDEVVFLVTEGSRLFLGQVVFEGNQAFSDQVLRRYVGRQGQEFLGTGRALFQPSALQGIAGRLRRHYLLAGYLDVRVADPETTRRGNRVDVRIEIDEGSRFTIGGVSVDGTEALPDQLASSVLTLTPSTGRTYTERAAADGADRIERYLGEQGYLTEVRYAIERDPESATVAIRYEFDETAQAILGDIRVRAEGDQPLRTRPFVVRNRFELDRGEPVNRSKVSEGRERLYQSGLFALVSTDLVEAEGDKVDLVVSVEEARNRFVELAAGWSNVEQLFGSLEYVDRNVLGTGRIWGVQAEGSFHGYRFSTRVVDRFVLGLNSRLAVEADHALRIRESFTERSTGANFLAEVAVTDDVRIGGTVELSFSRVYDPEDVPSDPDRIRLGTLNTRAAYNTVDNALFPTDGLHAGVSAAVSTSLGDPALRFMRFSADSAIHRTIGERIVLSGQIEASSILRIAEMTVPITERLYSGGGDSVRSFPEETLSPVDSDGRPVGGLTRIQGTLETRIRIVENLYGAVFYDIGTVAAEALSVTKPGHALGLGFRYRLPVGPLRIDAAYNPGPTFAADRRWAVHISVGSGF